MKDSTQIKQEDKTSHNIEEHVSVSAEYYAIGKMIHESLGEARIAHTRQVAEHKWESNPDVEKVEKTAKDFLGLVFNEYKQERWYRFRVNFLNKLFLTLNISLLVLITVMLANLISITNTIQLRGIIFLVGLLIIMAVIGIVGLVFISRPIKQSE